jgi:hypothetical protein
MAIDCKKAQRLLDSYHDRQLRGRKFDDVSEHLRECETCSSELEKLQCISRVLKEHYDSAVGAEDLSKIWARVDAVVGASDEDRSESLLDKIARILWIPKPAWVLVGAAALAVAIALAYLPGGPPREAVAENDCIIDSVDAHDSSVMVYELEEGRMQVIWVMEQQAPSTSEET